jgi:hypothetical protein
MQRAEILIGAGRREREREFVPRIERLRLEDLLLEAMVCGTSSSLVQVTVAPAFTVMRCGVKVNWSISTTLSAACAGAAGKAVAVVKTATASTIAPQSLRAIVVLPAEFSRLSPAAAGR